MAFVMLIGSLVPTLVVGHGAVTFPPPRNAIDSNEAPWGGKVPGPDVPFEPWCPMPSAAAAVSDPGRNLTGDNGQACFWFSNGCAIGCDECDGSTRGPIPAFDCAPGQSSNNCSLVPSPNNPHMQFGPKAPICKNPLNATVCDPAQRTVNTGAECGSPDDYFFYSPWRRPGSAPVIDACGSAGGRIPGQGPGGFGADFVNTTHAKLGDLGSKLPHTPSGVVWKAGDVVEVAWTLQANHGGGYSYRLCPLSENLTEACFQKYPLDFAGTTSTFRWGGVGGHQVNFTTTPLSEGTTPPGSMWLKNPIPRAWHNTSGDWGKGSNHHQTGYGFEPYCIDNGEDPTATQYSCTGMWGPYNLEIIDYVVIPAHLPSGDYVLGWRWDCEESNQIWQSCSDITIVSDYRPPTPPTCGMPGNNAGKELPNMPISANSSCACSQLCHKTDNCDGWTYAPELESGPGNDCWLRSEWAGPVYNCGANCWSGQKSKP